MRTSWDNHQMGKNITRSASLALQHQFFFLLQRIDGAIWEHVQVQVLVQYLTYRQMHTDILFRQPNGFPDVAVATGSPCPQTRGDHQL